MPDAWGICRGLFRPTWGICRGLFRRTRSPASLPRAADLARFAFAAKAFPQAIWLQHRLLVRLEASVGPTCFCRVGPSVSQQRKLEQIGILIQAERAIKVGLRVLPQMVGD